MNIKNLLSGTGGLCVWLRRNKGQYCYQILLTVSQPVPLYANLCFTYKCFLVKVAQDHGFEGQRIIDKQTKIKGVMDAG